MTQRSALGLIQPARATRSSINAGMKSRMSANANPTFARVPLGEIKGPVSCYLGSKPAAVEKGIPSVQLPNVRIGDKKNAQDCTEYDLEIYNYMRSVENENLPQPSLFENQSNITPKMRSTLIDWIVEVHKKQNMHTDTLFYIVAYIDRYLMERDLDKSKFQLLGSAAILLAAKTEEIYPPKCEKLVHYAGDSFTVIGLQRMEINLLNTLEFSTTPILSSQFLRRFLILVNSDMILNRFAHYVNESILLDSEFIGISPSKTAAAILYYSMVITNNSTLWTKDLERQLCYTKSELSPVANMIHLSLQATAASRYQAIRKKYATEQNEFVSTIELPKSLTL